MAKHDLEKVLNATTKALFEAGASLENARQGAVAMVQARDAANYLELNELHKTLTNELGESILAQD